MSVKGNACLIGLFCGHCIQALKEHHIPAWTKRQKEIVKQPKKPSNGIISQHRETAI